MTGSFPLTIETPDAIATQVLNVVFYGLPIEELQTFRERVNAVTVGRHPARRAVVSAAGSAVGRAGRQRSRRSTQDSRASGSATTRRSRSPTSI